MTHRIPIVGIIGALLLLVALQLFQALPAHARTEYMPCGTDDADSYRNCVWDARHMGNGLGHSLFVNRDGKVYRIPHHMAHYLVYGE